MQHVAKYRVGICDLVWAKQPEAVHLSSLDPTQHLVGRLFYPCNPDKRAGSSAVKANTAWLSSYNYAKGYCDFLFFGATSWKAWALKSVLKGVAYALGAAAAVPVAQGAAVDASGGPYPTIVFSHGLGGTRSTYSLLLAELVAQGYIVLAVEHADGTAAAVKLAGAGGWAFYAGLGGTEGKFAKQRFRMVEAQTAHSLLCALAAGTPPGRLVLSGGLDARTALTGLIDVERIAIVGHSFGGATAAGLCATDASFSCGITFDPWWYGVPPEAAALHRWQTQNPLLIQGSHDWNVPDSLGNIKCGGIEQQALMKAAAHVDGGSGADSNTGGGSILLVLRGTTHDSFNDVPVLFGARLGWIMRRIGFKPPAIEPATALKLISAATLEFLSVHMPAAGPPESAADSAVAAAATAATANGDATAPGSGSASGGRQQSLSNGLSSPSSSRGDLLHAALGSEARAGADVRDPARAGLPPAEPTPAQPNPHKDNQPASPGVAANGAALPDMARHSNGVANGFAAEAAAGAKGGVEMLGSGSRVQVAAAEAEQYRTLCGEVVEILEVVP